jgi:hypothetical protein
LVRLALEGVMQNGGGGVYGCYRTIFRVLIISTTQDKKELLMKRIE